MAIKSRPTQLNGINPLAYVGVNPYTPPAMYQLPRDPTVRDNAGFQIGDFWINETNNDLWFLAQKNISGTPDALWINLSAGAVETLTGDVGGPVSPDAADNINTFGTAGQILVTGNPATNTLTWSLDGASATQYTEDVGVAVPVGNNLNIFGTAGITTSGAGDTVTITNDGTIATQYDEDAGSAVPALGILNILGAGGIATSGAGNTVTIDGSGIVVTDSFPTDSGTAVPAAGVLNVLGGTSGRDINTSGAGNTIHIDLDNAITLGDLSPLTSADALTLTTGDLTLATGNIIFPVSNAAGTSGIVYHPGGLTFIISNVQNTYVGDSAGNLWGGVAGENIRNTAIGYIALRDITTGIDNDAHGNDCLTTLTTGIQNCSYGSGSLSQITSGTDNTCYGFQSGAALTTNDSDNICIGSSQFGVAGDNNTLRIGTATGAGTGQLNRAFISGIRGITTGVNDAVAVLVDSANQLGTVSSSIRYKENVNDMGSFSDDLLKLRPVVFNYKNDESKSRRFGLIAEEVKEVFPYLAAHNADGEVESVKYHELAAILLNEVIKLSNRVAELEKR